MANNTMELKYLVDYRQLQLANKEILKTGSNAQKSASVFEQAFRKVERENARQLSDVKKKIAFSQRMEAQKVKEARETQKALDQETQALHRLKMSTDASYASTYKLQSAKRILKKEVHEGRMTVEQYIAAMRKVVQANNAAAASANQASKHLSRTGVMTQQAGYQIGDFVVQVQSGQNALVAFGQQATQMAGTLTLLGGKFIAIGTVLGVALPLLTAVGAAFMRTRKEAESSSSVSTALKRLLNCLVTNFFATITVIGSKVYWLYDFTTT